MKHYLALLLVLVLMAGCSSAPSATPVIPSSPPVTSSPIPPTATFTASPLPPTDTPEATPTPNAFHFRLPASGCWMNSEISVRAGQTVVIRASGETNTWDGRQGSSGNPNGQTGLCGAIQCPLQGVGYGALIGRLEDLPPFFVGTTLRFNAAKDGQLYFTVNDWQCDDNSGVFDILITFP
jgi:hypothetical protein